MRNAKAGAWDYTARYGWNWRTARTIGMGLGNLALPKPSWFRMVVVRGLLTRTALHADARGIWGSGGPPPAGPAAPCPWTDIKDIVVWQHDHLKIIGLARYGDTVGVGPAARALKSRSPQQSLPTRRRAFWRHPAYPAFIAPDGAPYDAANVVTASGWCVDTARLRATVKHFAPHAGFVDLTGLTADPDPGGPIDFAVEVFAGLIELIGGRRLGWLLGVALSAAVLAVSAAGLGTGGADPVGLTVGALALALLIARAAVVRRRRRRSARPETWLDSARADAETSPLARLRRGRLAAWALRFRPLAVRRRGQGTGTTARRSLGAVRRRGKARQVSRLPPL